VDAGPETLDALGRYALRYVKPGQNLGLGTGRAASAFIRALGSAHIAVRGVATSHASADLARKLGIPLIELDDAIRVDTDFDGADEVDPRLNMIKGAGGAMLREKVVAAAARRRIFLVGEEKLVRRLGERGKLPIEVVAFAAGFAARALAKMGLRSQPRPARAGGGNYITDNGNLVLDCVVREIRNPARLEREIMAVPGVVGTGLFVAMADLVLVGRRDGTIETLRRRV
jgi:ribose 5-phosphate isomerase A